MKYSCLLFFLCNSLVAEGIFSSQENLTRYQKNAEIFFETYLTEQRGLDHQVGLSKGGKFPSSFSAPANPEAPAFISGYLPIVLVNKSGYPDSQVYFMISGQNLSAQNCWASIATSGIATLQPVESGQNSTSFMVPLSSLPTSNGNRVVYAPQTVSGLCWLSIGAPLNMGVSGGGIVQPNPMNPADPNYSTNYDIFEFNFAMNSTPQVFCDATAVSFFSIPQYGYLAGATSPHSNTGLYQPRSYLMSQISSAFHAAPENSQWNKLVLTSGNNVLRVIAPMKSMSIPSFDPNYLDNASAYGYSFLNDIWNSVSSFYQTNPCSMSINVTSPSVATYTYTGLVNPNDNTFVFNSTDGGPSVTLLAPTTSQAPTSDTTYLIFAAQNLTVPGGATQPTAGSAADALSKLFEEAIIAGLVPTTNTLSLSYFYENQANYYQTNPNLSSSGQSRGPWYDLYSKTLHGLGSIYTYGFDDALWPNVLLSGPYQDNTTYIGITIGNCEP